jgi:hypothetical protein
MNKQSKQKVAKLVLNLTGGMCFLVFGIWATLGTIVTALVAFTGGVFTYGLAFVPLAIVGALVFWGPLFFASAISRKIYPLVQEWANHEEKDPWEAKFEAHLKNRFAIKMKKG